MASRLPFISLAAVVTLQGMACSAVRGDDSIPLLVEVDGSSFVSRTCGPIPLTLRVQWGGNGILQGKLVMDLYDQGRDHKGTFVIDDLYVAPGEQRIDLLVPSLETTYDEQVDIRAELITASGRINLPPMLLRAPGLLKRTVVVTVGVPRTWVGERRRVDLVKWLSLESLQPRLDDSSRRSRQPITTLSQDVAVEDFPSDPHWHCASDVIVLPADGYTRLQRPQLEALLAWVRAGGSLCVFLDEDRLSPAQANALNQLMGQQAGEGPKLVVDRSGAILWEAQRTDFSSPQQVEFGLGRVVLARIADLKEIGQPRDEWREAAMFLWKFRTDQIKAVRETGTWTFAIGSQLAQLTMGNQFAPYQSGPLGGDFHQEQYLSIAADFQPRPISGGTALVENLMPRGIRIVPLWLIALVLLLYIVAVGPLDYLLLGMLRRRKYTWLLFPATTLGFLLFAVGLSNLYLQGGNHRGSATFRDIIDGGLIARENELQLLFAGSAQTATTEAPRSLFAALRFQDFGATNWRMRQTPQYHSTIPTLYQGRMPLTMTAVQPLLQWTPQLNRIMKIPRLAKPDDSSFDWDTPIDVQTPRGKAALNERIQKAFGTDVLAQAVVSAQVPVAADGSRQTVTMETVTTRGDRVRTSIPLPMIAAAKANRSRPTVIPLIGGGQVFASTYDQQYVPVATPGGGVNYQWVSVDFLKQASVREQPGLFSLVSRVSPMGGHRFEDMSLLDPSDPDAVLLIIAKQNADRSHWTIFRRVYRSAPPSSR